MNAATGTTTITCLGFGDAAELWGGTQVDFAVDLPGRPAREVAILLQDAAAEALAQAVAAEDGPDFRAAAARAVGAAWLEGQVERQGRIDSVTVIAAATLAERPDLVDAVRGLAA